MRPIFLNANAGDEAGAYDLADELIELIADVFKYFFIHLHF